MTAELTVTMPRRASLEIAVQDPSGAATAAAAGADRVELCSALDVGGLTPSLATIEGAVAVGIPVNVLVRPRGGGFRYRAAELSLMVRDVAAAVAAGASGVVVGALTDDGVLDLPAIAALCEAAAGRDVTVHRCVDVLDDPAGVLEALAELGVRRVLTSGGAPTAIEGAATLRRMVTVAAGRVEVMAGGGVRAADIPALLEVGVGAVHLSARAQTSDAGPAGPGGGPAGYDMTSAELVREAARALQ